MVFGYFQYVFDLVSLDTHIEQIKVNVKRR